MPGPVGRAPDARTCRCAWRSQQGSRRTDAILDKATLLRASRSTFALRATADKPAGKLDCATRSGTCSGLPLSAAARRRWIGEQPVEGLHGAGVGMTPGAIDRHAVLQRGPPFGRPALKHQRASDLAFGIGALRVSRGPSARTTPSRRAPPARPRPAARSRTRAGRAQCVNRRERAHRWGPSCPRAPRRPGLRHRALPRDGPRQKRPTRAVPESPRGRCRHCRSKARLDTARSIQGNASR